MEQCSYGCGQPGLVESKNGRSCCATNANKCPAKRKRDSDQKRAAGYAPSQAAKQAAWDKNRGKPSWSAGKTTLTDTRIAIRVEALRKRYESGELIHAPVVHTEESKARLSVIAKQRKLGGYVQGSGRGKKGWYKGIFCDSSWELAFVIWCNDHEQPIQRCTEIFQYEWDGQLRNYKPDFVVNGKIVEIKGYFTDQVRAKLDSAPVKIEVLSKIEMKPILEYVVNKYGKHFIHLYEPTGE